MNWQPIETAPKDGTKIIVFGVPHGSTSSGAPKYQFGYGPVGQKQSGEAYYSATLWQRKDGTWHDVTHWMPMPEPPVKKAESPSSLKFLDTGRDEE